MSDFLVSNHSFPASMTLSPTDAVRSIHKAQGSSEQTVSRSEGIAELVDMFCYLLDGSPIQHNTLESVVTHMIKTCSLPDFDY